MNQTKLIDDYLSDNMSPDERKEFEKSLESNPGLEAEVKLHAEINEAIIDEDIPDFRERIKKIFP